MSRNKAFGTLLEFWLDILIMFKIVVLHLFFFIYLQIILTFSPTIYEIFLALVAVAGGSVCKYQIYDVVTFWIFPHSFVIMRTKYSMNWYIY
jgi:hypothetical protein